MRKGGGRRADPKVVAAPPAAQGTVRREGNADAGTFPARPSRAFARSRPVGELRLGIRGWERSVHFAGANPLPRAPYDWRAVPTRLFSWFEAAQRIGRDGTGVVGPGLAASTFRGAERRDAPGGECPGRAQSGVAQVEAARRGRCVVSVVSSAAAGTTGAVRPTPIKLSDPSAAPAIRSAPAAGRVEMPPAPRPAFR